MPPFSKQRKGLEGNEKNNLMIPKKKELQINRRKKNICPPPLQSRKNLDGKKRNIVHLLQMKMKLEKKLNC